VKGHGVVEGKTVCSADLFFSFLPADRLGPDAGLPDIFSIEVDNDGQ
jgi:hypothetical protein